MPQLLVRKIEATVVRKLREFAQKEGVSMEEEHRRLLRQALLGFKTAQGGFKEFLLSIPPTSVREPTDLFQRQRDLPRKISL